MFLRCTVGLVIGVFPSGLSSVSGAFAAANSASPPWRTNAPGIAGAAQTPAAGVHDREDLTVRTGEVRQTGVARLAVVHDDDLHQPRVVLVDDGREGAAELGSPPGRHDGGDRGGGPHVVGGGGGVEGGQRRAFRL